LVLHAVNLPGDFDVDGDVDGQDLLAWQRNPNLGNLADWHANYGASALSASASVPEPTTCILLPLAALAFRIRAGRRNS
jgi:hypothetical protein